MARELTALIDIDFLPATYRERGMQRRAYAWRVAVALTIGGFFAATSLWQHNHHARVRARLDAVEAQYAEAARRTADLAVVSAELTAEEKTAELLTFLRHRWPRSRVLAAILAPLPESIRLSDCHVGCETRQAARGATIALPEGDEAPAAKPEQRANDLKRLLEETTRQEHFVSLSGKADDAATLHEYLARLQVDPLFARVELQSLEHQTADAPADRSVRFAVRAVLCEGTGQTIPDTSDQPSDATDAPPLARRGG